MKVVTCNIRCDCEAGTLNGFENRRGYLQEKFLSENVDVIGFQEVLPHVAKWLEEALPEYTILSCGREQHYDGEAATIAFHKKRFRLLNWHTFWLSDTEAVPGSRYQEQSIYPRVCSVASLQTNENGKCFSFFNTHLDHEWESARIKGIRKILYKMKESLHPVLLTGDLNTFTGSCVAKTIANSNMSLLDVTQGIGTTFHGYGTENEKLDYIYMGKEFLCADIKKWTDCHNGVYLSDHYPICAEIEWKS